MLLVFTFVFLVFNSARLFFCCFGRFTAFLLLLLLLLFVAAWDLYCAAFVAVRPTVWCTTAQLAHTHINISYIYSLL